MMTVAAAEETNRGASNTCITKTPRTCVNEVVIVELIDEDVEAAELTVDELVVVVVMFESEHPCWRRLILSSK